MLSLLRLPIAALLGLGMAAPAAATCYIQDAPLPETEVILTAPGGRSVLTRITDRQGQLQLFRLRRGTWTAQLEPGGERFTLGVGADRRLALVTVTRTTGCAWRPDPNQPPDQQLGHRPPPTVRRIVKQLNRPPQVQP